jgi:hypothetical protein
LPAWLTAVLTVGAIVAFVLMFVWRPVCNKHPGVKGELPPVSALVCTTYTTMEVYDPQLASRGESTCLEFWQTAWPGQRGVQWCKCIAVPTKRTGFAKCQYAHFTRENFVPRTDTYWLRVYSVDRRYKRRPDVPDTIWERKPDDLIVASP